MISGGVAAVWYTPFSAWCDMCREVIGDRPVIVCENCPDGKSYSALYIGKPMLSICMECWDNTAIKCMNHDHDYVRDEAKGFTCRRARQPNGVRCDRCQDIVQGLFFRKLRLSFLASID
jgi:hypothetical protein